MTDDTLADFPDQDLATGQAGVDKPDSVSAFVTAAITEHRRNHDGLSQLLADLGAGEQPTAADRTWARDVLGVS